MPASSISTAAEGDHIQLAGLSNAYLTRPDDQQGDGLGIYHDTNGSKSWGIFDELIAFLPGKSSLAPSTTSSTSDPSPGRLFRAMRSRHLWAIMSETRSRAGPRITTNSTGRKKRITPGMVSLAGRD